MPTLDDERFEAYLKRFCPLAPEPLPTSRSHHRLRRSFAIWAATAAAVILMATLAVRIRNQRMPVTRTTLDLPTATPLIDAQPLTVRSADALMAKAPSFKALLDDMAFRSQTIPFPEGNRSAVATLAKEKTRL